MTDYIMHIFAVVLTDLRCGDSVMEIMFISNVRCLWYWMSGLGALSFGWRTCCRVVCCCWKARMARNVANIPKTMPHVTTHWGYSSSSTGRRARRSFMFCVWEEKNSSYNALIWSVLTWLAHGMPEATFDFFTISTMELASLSRIFGTLCFHQLYSMILCGFHRVVPAQMETEELWFRDAIGREKLVLILWNVLRKHQRRLRMRSHPTYSSLEWSSPH